MTLGLKPARALIALALFVAFAGVASAQDPNNPGILDPVTTNLNRFDTDDIIPGDGVVRIPNTDQSVDGIEQTATHPDDTWLIVPAQEDTSLLGHPITHVASPNEDMRLALQNMVIAAQGGDGAAMRGHAQGLMDILLGKTEGRIYDGFAMLNYNRFKNTAETGITAEHFPADAMPGEYKMKEVRDTGERVPSPYENGKMVKVWEADVAMLYYDGQIDSDTFLLKFPIGHSDDDLVRINYRVYSVVREDFSPTVVTLTKRWAANTVQFPYKGLDSVWIAFEPGEVLHVTVEYPPARNLRGVYTWGWRVHPPRIQFLQPVYERLDNRPGREGEVIWDVQSHSFVYRNREDLTLDAISDHAPEMKMYQVAKAALDGASTITVLDQLTQADMGPRGTWIDWADLATEQRQLPDEAWDVLAAEDGLAEGEFGEYQMVTAIMNNEMYGQGPFLNEVRPWDQGEKFKIKLINLDDHTHYFRNVDFGTRLNDDILRCCGGGETSFEIMNFKPSYGAPKVAEMQWRAGWGFYPHYDIVPMDGLLARGSDRVNAAPVWSAGLFNNGIPEVNWGYLYSEENRQGDFRFLPPPFIIGDNPFNGGEWATNPLRDADGQPGLLIGQRTEGYGTGQMCPGDPYPGFCTTDIQAFNPNAALNFPPPPLRGQPVMPVDVGKFPGDVYPDHPVELRYPPFLRNPCQGEEDCGDIIPPTGAWRPFLFYSPQNGTLFNNGVDNSDGYWADKTFSHGATIFAGETLNATVELPRASGQVFYQFDDLFHDNMIFSPHPLAEGEDVLDTVKARAFIRKGVLRVRGFVSPMSNGDYSNWVVVFDGPMGANGCEGNAIGLADVRQSDGTFVLRCGPGRCFNPRGKALPTGAELCIQSSTGGMVEAAVN